MATQRLFVATLAGAPATAVEKLFASWRAEANRESNQAVDRFCHSLRENSTEPAIVYFAEWIDRWLMGDHVPGSETVSGAHFEATAFTREEAIAWAGRLRTQSQEEEWLASRLREAATAWNHLVEQSLVVVVREVLGRSARDSELHEAMGQIPLWLDRSR